jgi:hypothetical protein
MPIVGKRLIGRDLEGSQHGLTAVLSWQKLADTEEN